MSPEFFNQNWHLFLALVIITLMLIWEFNKARVSGVEQVSALDMPRVMRDPSVIIDVCEPKEYKSGHISDAINIPLSSLAKQTAQLEKHKNKNLILTCRHGNRSITAGRQLHKQGFEKLYSLSGGIMAWEKENLPVIRG